MSALIDWHEHFFSPQCTDEVNGRFDAVEDATGIYVIDVGNGGVATRFSSRDEACSAAKTAAEQWTDPRQSCDLVYASAEERKRFRANPKGHHGRPR